MNQRGYWSKATSKRITRRRIIAATGALTASAAFLAACGGDDDDTSSDEGGGTSSSGGGVSPTTATGSSGTASPKTGGTFRKNHIVPNDPANFDMHGVLSGHTWIVSQWYSQLLMFSETKLGDIEPDLAESHEVSGDGLTLTFKLREATFHDGTPFTSEDVRVTMEKVINPPEGIVSIRQGQFAGVARVEAPDDRTFVFHMKSPSASFLGTLAVRNIVIYAAKDILADPEFHKTNVNGTGPYIPGDIRPGSLYVSLKNPDYWDEGKPYLDRWEWYLIPEQVARLAAFTAGDLDFYRLFPAEAEEAKQVESLPNVTTLQAPGTGFDRYAIATFKEPWTDERTWTAISLAISRQDLGLARYGGLSTISAMGIGIDTQWALSEEDLLNVPGYKGLGDGQESDMETRWAEARKLLLAAGIEDGQPIGVFGADTNAPHAEVAADGLRHVGINPTIELVESAVYAERLDRRDYGDFSTAGGNAAFPDPTPVYADTYLDGAPRNYQEVYVPEADDLFRQQESEFNPERRIELAREMQRVYLAKYPLEVGPFLPTVEAFYNYVKGYTVLYGSHYQDRSGANIWLDK